MAVTIHFIIDLHPGSLVVTNKAVNAFLDETHQIVRIVGYCTHAYHKCSGKLMELG